MNELDDLLYPIWGSEQWIKEGWTTLSPSEKEGIKQRVQQLFVNGIPFRIKHEKQLYIYMFALMSQLEVLAIQLPLRFAEKIENPYLKERMRAQLLDEIFHAIVFTKTVFMLSAPHQFPPTYNEKIEEISRYVRSIECPKIGLVVMNLVCENLVEEVFSSLYENDIASDVFKVILKDEHRHVCETELYREIGLPEKERLEEELKKLEGLIVSAFSLESEYAIAVSGLLGAEATSELIRNVQEKHQAQLNKLGVTASEEWELLLHLGLHYRKKFKPPEDLRNEMSEIEMTPMRKTKMTQFNAPGDPTMTAQFDLDISSFGFFDNKYSHELLTPLIMQTISYVLSEQDEFRHFLCYQKLQLSQGAYVAIMEKLPNCADQLGTIFFRNCHELHVETLPGKIEKIKEMMVYAYHKRALLEVEFPHLTEDLQSVIFDSTQTVYPFPAPGHNGVFVSNIGSLGYNKAQVPLSKHMGICATLLDVERKQVWNNEEKLFVVKDVLPISFSADARVFDGLVPVPHLINEAFQIMLKKMNNENQEFLDTCQLSHKEYNRFTEKFANILLEQKKLCQSKQIIFYLMSKKNRIKEMKNHFAKENKDNLLNEFDYIAKYLVTDYLKFDTEEMAKNQYMLKLIDKLLNENRVLGYRLLCYLQTVSFDYLEMEDIVNDFYQQVAKSRLNKLMRFLPQV